MIFIEKLVRDNSALSLGDLEVYSSGGRVEPWIAIDKDSPSKEELKSTLSMYRIIEPYSHAERPSRSLI